MSQSTHSILASDLGLQEEAYRLFEGACLTDLGPNMKSSDLGIHAAAMGGIWQGAVFGFGGVRIRGGELHIAPKLPNAWEQMRFLLHWKGNPLWIECTKKSARIENAGEETVTIILNGEKREIPPKGIVDESLSLS